MNTKLMQCLVAGVSLLVAPVVLHAQLPLTDVSLRISSEIAPPGGIAQLKVSVTEPRPISTGGLAFEFDGFDGFAGITVLSPGNDTWGTAQVNGTQLRFAVRSTTGSWGTESNYPILAVAARVPATTPLGTVLPVSFPPGAISLLSPTGVVYATETQDGSVTVDRGISIEDVIPGSADLPAGSVVTIVGRGFEPATRVRFNEVALSAVRFVDAAHLQVVLAEPARMHGMRIRAENPSGARTTYFSYQRTRRQGLSTFAVLQHTVPLFPLVLTIRADVDISSPSSAIAVQNIGAATAKVAIDLVDPQGHVLGTVTRNVKTNRFRVNDVSELFGAPPAGPATLRVRSTSPIQVMGIELDSAGDATPIVPRF
jgi:hypothetical protein